MVPADRRAGLPAGAARRPARGRPAERVGVLPALPAAGPVRMELSGASFAVAGSVVATLLGVVAAVAIGVLLRDRLGPRAALLAVAVWAAGPATATLQVAYTESAAMALLALVLLALSRSAGGGPRAGRPARADPADRRPARRRRPRRALAAVAAPRPRPRRPGRGGGAAAALVGCAVAGFLWPVIAWWATGRQDAYEQTMGRGARATRSSRCGPGSTSRATSPVTPGGRCGSRRSSSSSSS